MCKGHPAFCWSDLLIHGSTAHLNASNDWRRDIKTPGFVSLRGKAVTLPSGIIRCVENTGEFNHITGERPTTASSIHPLNALHHMNKFQKMSMAD